MSRLPYHLRTNKAADRLAMIEAIRLLPRLGDGDLDKYTYFGFGGPYLEDMRLIYESCPEIQMLSIEEEEWIYNRQQFHRPCGEKQLILEKTDSWDFISKYKANDKKSIFWLDYTDLQYSRFEEFIFLLRKVVKGSMIKLTFRATPSDFSQDYGELQNDMVEIFQKKFETTLPYNLKGDFWKSEEFKNLIKTMVQDALQKKDKEALDEFRNEFGNVLPSSFKKIPVGHEDLAELIQSMIKIASQKAFPPDFSRFAFYPISSFYYTDTNKSWMLTLTGVVWPSNDFPTIKKAYRGWKFANLDWAKPKKIDIPDLSTKERLCLQCHLPDSSLRGNALQEKLGHLIDKDPIKTNKKLEQYADFHRYFPYFLRGIP